MSYWYADEEMAGRLRDGFNKGIANLQSWVEGKFLAQEQKNERLKQRITHLEARWALTHLVVGGPLRTAVLAKDMGLTESEAHAVLSFLADRGEVESVNYVWRVVEAKVDRTRKRER